MDILVTAPDGRIVTLNIDDPRLTKALAEIHGAGISDRHTASAMYAGQRLRDGHVVEARGWKFEPIADAEVA